MNIKKCQWCELEKPLAAFDRRVSSPDGRQDRCKRCIARYRRVAPPATRRSLRKPRRSPYENMAEVLDSIWQVLPDTAAALVLIREAREKYRLAS